MKLDTIWLVCDPTADSEMCDICWEQKISSLHYQIFGAAQASGRNDWQARNHTAYTTQTEAWADATARLAARLPTAERFAIMDQDGTTVATIETYPVKLPDGRTLYVSVPED